MREGGVRAGEAPNELQALWEALSLPSRTGVPSKIRAWPGEPLLQSILRQELLREWILVTMTFHKTLLHTTLFPYTIQYTIYIMKHVHYVVWSST